MSPLKWRAQYRLSWKVGDRWRRVEVFVQYDGSAYTRREWLAGDFADFAREPATRRWYFQGKPFRGRVIRLQKNA